MGKDILAMLFALVIGSVVIINYNFTPIWDISIPLISYFLFEALWGIILGHYRLEDISTTILITFLSIVSILIAAFFLINILKINYRFIIYTLVPILTFLIRYVFGRVILEISE
ncbi:hypothetical protein [Natronospora cellulosivora (SeqCode)]